MRQVVKRPFWRTWSWFVRLVSGEWVLDQRPNGGDVIVIRSALIAIEIYLLAILIKQGSDPTRANVPSWQAFAQEVHETAVPWMGAVFAAAYAALYTRFSAQWTYLADLYNQIKSTQARTVGGEFEAPARSVLSEWKAGFIEDAKELHLVAKPLFLSIVRAWLDDSDVREAYVRNARDGVEGLNLLIARVNREWQSRRPNATPIEYARGSSSSVAEDTVRLNTDLHGNSDG